MADVARNTVKRGLMVATASVAWFALFLQVPLTIRTSLANGMTLIGAVLTYFSFFTLLTNLLAAAVLSAAFIAPKSRWGRQLSSPVVTTGTALYITTVGLVYFLLLRHTWNPQGLDKLTDILLHDVVPVMYVLFWVFFVPKSGLRWRDTLYWAIYPMIYFVWILIRGALSGRYPYPFVDVGKLGYSRVLLNAVALLGIFLVGGLGVVAVSRWTSPNLGDR